jgi:hypothetical protein
MRSILFAPFLFALAGCIAEIPKKPAAEFSDVELLLAYGHSLRNEVGDRSKTDELDHEVQARQLLTAADVLKVEDKKVYLGMPSAAALAAYGAPEAATTVAYSRSNPPSPVQVWYYIAIPFSLFNVAAKDPRELHEQRYVSSNMSTSKQLWESMSKLFIYNGIVIGYRVETQNPTTKALEWISAGKTFPVPDDDPAFCRKSLDTNAIELRCDGLDVRRSAGEGHPAARSD